MKHARKTNFYYSLHFVTIQQKLSIIANLIPNTWKVINDIISNLTFTVYFLLCSKQSFWKFNFALHFVWHKFNHEERLMFIGLPHVKASNSHDYAENDLEWRHDAKKVLIDAFVWGARQPIRIENFQIKLWLISMDFWSIGIMMLPLRP